MLDDISSRVPTRNELEAAQATFEHASRSIDSLAVSLAQIRNERQDLAEPMTAEQAWLLHDFADAIETFADSAADHARGVKTSVRYIWVELDSEAVSAA